MRAREAWVNQKESIQLDPAFVSTNELEGLPPPSIVHPDRWMVKVLQVAQC